MVSSKEFKQAIREGRLNDAFVIAMGNAPELHITTWIASPDDKEKNFKPRGGECLRTHVNLVEGEIINEIGEELIEDNLYGTLQEFHLQQVNQGHQTISQNLQSIQQMFRLLAILQKQQNGEKYNQLNTWKIADTSLPAASTPKSNFYSSNRETDPNFVLDVESNDLQFTDEDEDDVISDLLSLDELELDIEEESSNVRDTQQSEVNNEDWGDWLSDNTSKKESEINSEMLDLDSLELDDDEDWQEDWGDETEFLSNPTTQKKEDDSNN